MTTSASQLSILFKQELKELYYSRFFYFIGLVYLVFWLVFIFIGMKESIVHGFTGMGRVLYSLTHVFVFILPILALSASSTTLTQYRENGTMEFLFSHPVTKKNFLLSLTISRLFLLAVPLLALFLISILIGFINLMRSSGDQSLNFILILKLLVVSISLIWCFQNIGIYLSEKIKSQTKALIIMLLVWITAVFFLDFSLIGLMLKFNINPEILFGLAALNPVQVARLALLSELDSELSTLGPIGFFMSNHLGSTFLFILGFAWPFFLGCIFWLTTYYNLKKNSLI